MDDPALLEHYSADTCREGKDAARRALRQKLKLVDSDKPLVGVVSRLTAQKGVALLKVGGRRGGGGLFWCAL